MDIRYDHSVLDRAAVSAVGADQTDQTDQTDQLIFVYLSAGEKPYVCTVHGCGKRFTEYSSLYKHHVVHTHAKPYVCNHCGKNYRQTSTLAMHKRTAHGDDTALDDADQQFVFTQEAEPTDQSECRKHNYFRWLFDVFQQL